MPTYEYACDACDHHFEAFQSITAAPLKKCPECGKSKLRRLISAGGGVIFKGSGFYETDYRSESYKKSAEAESKAASGDGEKKTGDSKPAEKATDAAAPKPTAAAESTGGKVSTPVKAETSTPGKAGSGSAAKAKSAKKTGKG